MKILYRHSRPRVAPLAASLLVSLVALSGEAVVGSGDGGPSSSDGRQGSLWVVNRDLGELTVFDVATGRVAARIPVGAGAHDICISERAGKAYITAETIHTVTAVDLRTLETEAIPVAPLPHHIEPSKDGRIIYVTLASHSTTVGTPTYAAIDTEDHSVRYTTTSLNPAARAHGPYPSRNGKTIYVAHDTGDEVTAVDAETGNIDLSIPQIVRAEEVLPSRLGARLWVSSRGDGTVKRIDLRTGRIESLAIGVQPESLALTPSEEMLAVSLRGSPATLALVDAVRLKLVASIPLAGAGTFGDLAVMSPEGRFVYATFDAAAAGTGGVAVVDLHKGMVVASWPYPGTGRPHGLWYSTRKAQFPRVAD